MFGYKITKNGKTICLGIADSMKDVLGRLPGGRYKLKERVINKVTNKVELFYESDLGALPAGMGLGEAMDYLKEDGFAIWQAVVREDVTDLTDVLFEEVQKIWNS